MAQVTVVWDDLSLAMMPRADGGVVAVVDRIAAGCVQTMKFLTPVSPPGPKHRSGNLRSSVHAFRQPNGDMIIGPTADYAKYVNDDTVPHIIRSHGNYPLRDEYGHVFGPEVHHPGTRGQHFIEKTAESLQGRVYHT